MQKRSQKMPAIFHCYLLVISYDETDSVLALWSEDKVISGNINHPANNQGAADEQ